MYTISHLADHTDPERESLCSKGSLITSDRPFTQSTCSFQDVLYQSDCVAFYMLLCGMHYGDSRCSFLNTRWKEYAVWVWTYLLRLSLVFVLINRIVVVVLLSSADDNYSTFWIFVNTFLAVKIGAVMVSSARYYYRMNNNVDIHLLDRDNRTYTKLLEEEYKKRGRYFILLPLCICLFHTAFTITWHVQYIVLAQYVMLDIFTFFGLLSLSLVLCNIMVLSITELRYEGTRIQHLVDSCENHTLDTILFKSVRDSVCDAHKYFKQLCEIIVFASGLNMVATYVVLLFGHKGDVFLAGDTMEIKILMLSEAIGVVWVTDIVVVGSILSEMLVVSEKWTGFIDKLLYSEHYASLRFLETKANILLEPRVLCDIMGIDCSHKTFRKIILGLTGFVISLSLKYILLF